MVRLYVRDSFICALESSKVFHPFQYNYIILYPFWNQSLKRSEVFYDYDYDLLWYKVGHNGPEEPTYIKQVVGLHTDTITVNG